MGERYFSWDEISEGLILSSVTKAKDEQIKRRKKHDIVTRTSDIYCPHAYLILNYQETLNDNEKIKFRKHYLRKITPTESNIIILQDIKDLVLFLLITPIGSQFINFFHLAITDRFLRALIIYFQSYVEIWEDLMQERVATMKKAPNPLARGHRSLYAEEMRILRYILGREYIDLIAGCQSGSQYHHMMIGRKQLSAVIQSQGERDLRIFEVLISVAHRVIWIALQRKYYNLIEVELHRLFRTDAYNIAQRQSGGNQVIQDMLEDDIRILHGPKIALRRKLLRNSPLLHELIYSYCDYRLLLLGIVDIDVHDPKIMYLNNALFAEEELLPQLGIKVGILGQNRSNYDIMLNELQQPVDLAEIILDKETVEKRKSVLIEKISIRESIPHKVPEEFPMKESEISTERYDKILEDARKKWILREIRRHHQKTSDTYSLTTTD